MQQGGGTVDVTKVGKTRIKKGRVLWTSFLGHLAQRGTAGETRIPNAFAEYCLGMLTILDSRASMTKRSGKGLVRK